MIIHNLPVKDDEMLMRAYSPEIETWVTGNVIYFGPNDYRICGIDPETGVINTYNIIWETLTNYTGYNDRNGAKIFTGDIISIDYIPEKKYIYACANGIAEIAPVGYVSKGQKFAETEKMKLDLSKGNITSHIEITANVLQNILPSAMERWRKRNDMPLPDDDDDEDYLDDEDGDIYDFTEDEDISPEEWLDEDTVEIEYDDDEDDFSDVMPAVPITDMVDHKEKYRALSIDTTMWVFGSPVYSSDKEDDASVCSIINVENDEVTVTPVIPHTVGRISDIIDKHNRLICAGDIIILDNCSASVIMFIRDANEFGVIPYNMYETPFSEERANWNIIVKEVWKANPQNIEIVGNVYTGFTDEFERNLEEHMKEISGLDMTSLPSEITADTAAGNTDKKSLIYDTASNIDALIYNVNPDIRGWYTYDFNSIGDECIIYGRWCLTGEYEMRMTFNAKTLENSIHFGKYDLCRDEWKNHGVISHSHNSYTDMVDSIVNVLLTTDPYDKIMNFAVKFPSNLSSKDFRMKKDLSYDNVLQKKFGDRETVSQKEWIDTMRNCFSKKTIEKIDARSYDTIGVWCHGHHITLDGNDYIRTVNAESQLKRAGTVNEQYTKSSFCMNTFMTDKDGKFIYSSDIVEYEGLGKVIIYASTDTDPNDPVRSVPNDEGDCYLYWMRLDKLCDVITDAKNHHLEWVMINPAEWHRNRDKICVVGNMIDYFIENETVILNSKDFDDIREKDAMSFVFEEGEIVSTSPMDNEKYWDRLYENEDKNADNIAEFLNQLCIYSVLLSEADDVNDFPIDFRTLELSDGTPVTQMNVYTRDEDVNVVVYICGERGSVIVTTEELNGGNPSIFCKDCKLSEMAEFIGEIIDSEDNIIDILNSHKNTVIIDKDVDFTSEYSDDFFSLINDCDDITDRKSYIKKVKEFMKPADMEKVSCRALNKYGEFMLGRPDYKNKDIFINYLTGNKEHYIRETLCFNTWLVDAGGEYIFDNDNILFGGQGQQMMFTMNHKRRLTLDDEESWKNEQCSWKKYYKIISEEDQMMRCVSQVLIGRLDEEALDELQWVPVDIQWMIRNTHRLMVIGNFIDSNPN